MGIELEALGAFGVEVRNIASADLADPTVCEELRQAWIRHGLVVFRHACGPELQLSLSRVFGPLMQHPLVGSRAKDYPDLMDVLYEPNSGDLYEIEGVRRGILLPWHKDLIYTDRINHGGILRPIRLPPSGGETGFLDQIALYESLPSRLKQRIEELFVIYLADFHIENARFARLPAALTRIRYGESTVKAQAQTRNAPRVLHPMVFVQRETGRKVLNVSPWFAVGIQGQENATGERLLQDVIDHCLNEGYAYYHSWRVDDMVLFDNWRMLHCLRSVPGDASRWMQRTTIEGDYARGRIEKPGLEIRDAMRVSV